MKREKTAVKLILENVNEHSEEDFGMGIDLKDINREL